jgi:hypothetical protein
MAVRTGNTLGQTQALSISEVLNDPSASYWLKGALTSALARDPVDAANDADLLARMLDARCRSLLENTDQRVVPFSQELKP